LPALRPFRYTWLCFKAVLNANYQLKPRGFDVVFFVSPFTSKSRHTRLGRTPAKLFVLPSHVQDASGNAEELVLLSELPSTNLLWHDYAVPL
jgi:hypothetical protein